MDEFLEGTQEEHVILLVKDHKGTKPEKLVVSGRLLEQFKDWVCTLRPLHVCGECPYVFCTETGEKLSHLSRDVSKLADEFGTTLPNATNVRKAIATKGGELETSAKTALAHAMSHSVETADRYYRAYGESKNLQGFSVIRDILEINPEEKKRHRFTAEQTDLLADYFSVNLATKQIPRPAELEKFLVDNRERFPGRKRSDIYSKVRNLIGRRK